MVSTSSRRHRRKCMEVHGNQKSDIQKVTSDLLSLLRI